VTGMFLSMMCTCTHVNVIEVESWTQRYFFHTTLAKVRGGLWTLALQQLLCSRPATRLQNLSLQDCRLRVCSIERSGEHAERMQLWHKHHSPSQSTLLKSSATRSTTSLFMNLVNLSREVLAHQHVLKHTSGACYFDCCLCL
jgi:hypothetical protein